MCQNLVKSDHGVHDQLSLLCLWEKTSILFYSFDRQNIRFFFLFSDPLTRGKSKRDCSHILFPLTFLMGHYRPLFALFLSFRHS